MNFDNLSSQVIKTGIVSKLAFSLGFKLISSVLKAEQWRTDHAHLRATVDFETGEIDMTLLENEELAKRKWAEFTAWAETNEYAYSPIAEIAEAYVKGSGKPIQKASPEVLELRAKVSGQSVAHLKAQADKQTAITQAKVQTRIQKIIADLQDIKQYANGFYNLDKTSQWGTLVHSSVDIEEILTDEFVEDAYEKVLKSQINFWNRYGNWDDAELFLIAEDKKVLGL